MVMEQKSGHRVQFEITQSTREPMQAWITHAKLNASYFLFISRVPDSRHLSVRRYARIVHGWVEEAGLKPGSYGTHTIRRTKAPLIYRRTRNLRGVQLLLGYTKLKSTVRYRGLLLDQDGRGAARSGDASECWPRTRQRAIQSRLSIREIESLFIASLLDLSLGETHPSPEQF